jgi:2-polyprenyl-3-methyl-5-hydroxy-6-metoxy-1,4-benzoquinol methylase
MTPVNNKNCFICQSTDISYLYDINDFGIYRCNECTLVFVHFYFENANELLLNFYSKEYFNGTKKINNSNIGYNTNYFFNKKKENIINAKQRLKKIGQLFPGKGKILDVGCAAGFFLKVASDLGWKAAGIEISPEAVEFAQTSLDLNVICGRFETTDFKENSFQVITAWDVIEHVLDPVVFVEKAKKLLVPGGLLVLGTPNIGSLAALIRGKHWPILKPPEHLFYFNPATLTKLLKTQFDDVTVQPGFPPYSKVKPEFRAYVKRLLYNGFNIVAQVLRRGEYLVAYARK